MPMMNGTERGMVTREARPILQSRRKIKTRQAAGAPNCEGASGITWAMESSSFPTLSTINVLYTPDGVSNITPKGTRRIWSAMARRMFLKMVKAIL